MFETESSLSQIKKSLSEVSSPSPWNHLKDLTSKMSDEQISWTLKQDSVKATWEALKTSFDSWLFERFKEEFSQVKAYQPLIESYISSIGISAEAFGQRARSLEEENLALKKKLEELQNAKRPETN